MDLSSGWKIRTLLCAIALIVVATPPVPAQGRTEINQARALAGGVTPGDTPGFPVTLDRPGSYVLSSDLDLSGEPNPRTATGIMITSSFVTVDLDGFALRSGNLCDGTQNGCTWDTGGSGIAAGSSATRGIAIRHGTIRGFGGHGLDLQNSVGVRIEEITVLHAGRFGWLLGDAASIERSRADSTGDGGAYLGRATALLDSEIAHAGFVGAYIGEGSLALRNRILSSVSFAYGCKGDAAPFEEFALAESLLVDNNPAFGDQFIASCANELGPDRCGADTSCP